MDKQTKYEIWLLTIGALVIEAPFAAIALVGH
jgi:hypothetical protein